MAFDCPQYYPSGGASDFVVAAFSKEGMYSELEKRKHPMADLEINTFDTDTMEFTPENLEKY